jgi:hypothetical protein
VYGRGSLPLKLGCARALLGVCSNAKSSIGLLDIDGESKKRKNPPGRVAGCYEDPPDGLGSVDREPTKICAHKLTANATDREDAGRLPNG